MIRTTKDSNVPDEFLIGFSSRYRDLLDPEWIGTVYGIRDWEYSMALYNTFVVPDDVVLDIGCGESYFGGYISSWVKQSVGVDNSNWNNFTEWENTLPLMDDVFEFVKACAGNLPFSDETFDKVFTFSAFEHFGGNVDKAAAKEVYRVLKPGGIFSGTVDQGIEGECYTLAEFLDRIVNHADFEMCGKLLAEEITTDHIISLFFKLRKPI